MKIHTLMLLLLASVNLLAQDSLFVNAYNTNVFSTILNGADANKSPIRHVDAKLQNWLFLKFSQDRYIESIEIDFLIKPFVLQFLRLE